MPLFLRKDIKQRSWAYEFTYKGKRYRATLGNISKTRAKELYEKAKVAAREEASKPPKKENPFLRDVVNDYFDYYRANRKKNSVDRHYYSWIAVQPTFGHYRMSEITPLMIEKYRQNRPLLGRSNVTINRELAFLRNVYSMAVKWHKAEDNPVKEVKQAREDNLRIRFLNDEEEPRLLGECKIHLYLVVLTAIHTGLRRGELLSLIWNNIDFERRLVTVEAGYSKNHEPRNVPMSLRLTETLEPLKMAGSDPVFLNSNGDPYRNVTTAFNSAVKRAKIEDFVFYDLRHTFASRLVMAGVDLTTVKELMGHKTIQMTLRYSHLSPAHKHAAVAVFDSN